MTSQHNTEGSPQSPFSGPSSSPSTVTLDLFPGVGERQASPSYVGPPGGQRQHQTVPGHSQPHQQHDAVQLHYPLLAPPASQDSRYSINSSLECTTLSGSGSSSDAGAGKRRPGNMQRAPDGSSGVRSCARQDHLLYTNYSRSKDEAAAAVATLPTSFASPPSEESQRGPQQQPPAGTPVQDPRQVGGGLSQQLLAAADARQAVGGCVQSLQTHVHSLSPPQNMQSNMNQQQMHGPQSQFQQVHGVQTPGLHTSQQSNEQQVSPHALMQSVPQGGPLPPGTGVAATQQPFQAPPSTQHQLPPQTHQRSIASMRQSYYSPSGSAPASHQDQGVGGQQFSQQPQEALSSRGIAPGVQQTPYLPRGPSQQGQSQRQSPSSFNSSQTPPHPQQAHSRHQDGNQQSQPVPTRGVIPQQGGLFQAPAEGGQPLPAEALHQQGVQYHQRGTQLLSEQGGIQQAAFQRTQVTPLSSQLPDTVHQQQQQSQLRQHTQRQSAHQQEQQPVSRTHSQSPNHPPIQAQRLQEQQQGRQQQPQQTAGASQLQSSPQQASKQVQLAHAHQPLQHQSLVRHAQQQQLLQPPPQQLQARLQHSQLHPHSQPTQSPQQHAIGHMQSQQQQAILQARPTPPHQLHYHPLTSQPSSSSHLHVHQNIFQSQQPQVQSGYPYGKTQSSMQQPPGSTMQHRMPSSQFISPGESLPQLGSAHSQLRHPSVSESGNKSPKLERSSSSKQRRPSPAGSDIVAEETCESPSTSRKQQRPPKSEPGIGDRGGDAAPPSRDAHAVAFSDVNERDRDRISVKMSSGGVTGAASNPVDGPSQERKAEIGKDSAEEEEPVGGSKFPDATRVGNRPMTGQEGREPGTGQTTVTGVKTDQGGGRVDSNAESTDARYDRYEALRDADAMREDGTHEARAPKRMKVNDLTTSEKTEDKTKRGGDGASGIRGDSPGVFHWRDKEGGKVASGETGEVSGSGQEDEDTGEELREAETGFTLQDYFDFTEDVASLMGAFADPHIEAMEAEAVDAMVRLCLQFIDDAVERAVSIAIAIQSESSITGPVLPPLMQDSVFSGLSPGSTAAGSLGVSEPDRFRTLDVKLLAEHCLLAFCNASRRKFNRCRQVLHTHRQVQQMLCAYDDTRMTSCSPIYPPPPPGSQTPATSSAETGATGGGESVGIKKKKKAPNEAGAAPAGCREALKEPDEKPLLTGGPKGVPEIPLGPKADFYSHPRT
ncbi:hypothetical protein CSUI_002619 [Cystoisospora suis]|uniref:Uncharacterized protein n=1 Tax=Cystoisospora suis TaxID=483139 RepID=A0A2C6L7D3_9APIC|nr:hypothetical protein CSUI_002619 [Cystoisospora suis]